MKIAKNKNKSRIGLYGIMYYAQRKHCSFKCDHTFQLLYVEKMVNSKNGNHENDKSMKLNKCDNEICNVDCQSNSQLVSFGVCVNKVIVHISVHNVNMFTKK